MVRAGDVSTAADGWREAFDGSRLVPAPSPAVRRAAESHLAGSQGFQLRLGRLAAAPLPQSPEMPEVERDLTHQLRVTLFDQNHRHFFGKTWKSPAHRMTNNKICFNEVLYFHTSVRLPSTVVVLELVLLSPRPDGSQQALGRGFTVLELFTSRPEAQAADGDRRLDLHHGSPRSLLHPLLKDSVDYSSLLKTIDGAHLDCVVKSHPAMVPMMHLLPENVLVSGDENIPGLAASPTGDALLRPQLLKMLPFTLNRLTISLQPSLETFESQLLQLINADCHNTKQPGPEGALSTVAIQERRLHVGVHNGWCFLDKPQVVVLELLASGARGRADSTSKRSTSDSSAPSSLPQVLGLRSSLELKVTNHQALAIVFQLEYVFSAPIGRETMLSATSSSRAAFLQCLRWGIFCPFQQPADWKGEEIQLVLRGGAKPNPYGVMVYGTEMPAKAQSSVPLSAPGTTQVNDVITFRLSSGLERKASSPKASLRTRQEDVQHERRLPSSPLRVQKRLPAASPPESPQGPGAFSAVSNIAHLEMDLQRDGDVSPSAQNEGAQLEELPFTPVHAPVITLGMNVPSSSSVSSRSSLAHLYSAGFPQIVDCGGQVADVLDPTEPVHFDPQREETDLLQGNLPVFQFLAFTRIPIAGAGPDWPRDVYFTFQFYRFPPVTSQQLKLLTSNRVQHKTSDPLPCVLAPAGKDGTVNPGSPGLQVQFRVDDAFLRPGEKRWFLRYLALHTMHIDIWDSESLLLIGSTAIELKYMLRQGKTAVQALHEVEVLTTDYVGEDALLTSAGLGQRSASGPMTVHTIVRGRLHVRTGNIGCLVDAGRRRVADATPSPSHIITPRKVTSGFRGGSLSPRNILHLNARIAAQPHRPEIDGGRVPLHRRGLRPDDILPGEHHRHEADGGRRKLDCMAAVLQREAKEGVKAVKATGQTREAQLARERLPIEPREERSKVEGIANMLSQAITTQHLLFASLGSAEYMEFVLKNPFNVPQTVTILSDDPELSVIANTEEWQYFKALTQTPTPLEENMFQWEEGAPGPRVYLRPKESIHIPLKYQSFLCDHTMALQGPGYLPTGKGSQMAKKNLSNIVAAKTIKVAFKAEDGKPMAICQVNVEPTPHVVDQTFRLYHPELCFLKKALRLPPWHDPAVEAPDGRTHISVRCSDPNIICQTRMLVPGEPQDVYLKVPGSPSPTVKKFFVMVFTDKWMAAPSQIWQVYVHFLERVDVGCVTGQRTCQSLVLRGKQTVRKVKCFSSHPKEIQVDPEGVFVLPPSAVQELQVKVQPWRAGSRFLYVNAVDVENQRLITAWLLCLNVHQPVLSKAFEVSVPVGGGRGSSRKITYTNPYTSGRTFLLRSDHPDLLQFRQDKFQISGGESYTIGLRFAPSQSPGSVEIMVYVNNLEEKTEETFCVKVNYS
ncbi:nephrocystin-4 isoform X2 [Scophthalmus maximus]|uniref:nephrocystin-4 isoform X2 n=1 Tax=Scophthalmus maximus TaxID=52904 RepID=UPI001FA93031|nr:nephrocystin-4 isoform X2 [Scophthalmus maximus]